MNKLTPVHRAVRWASLPGLLLVACAMSGCAKHEAPPPPSRLVRSVVVTNAPSGTSTTYTAEIRSRYETDLSFQVGGKLIARAVDTGATVRKGEVLAQIDQADQHLSVEAARSAVNAAQAELIRSRSEEARHRDLIERGLTTRAAYLTQQTAVKTAQSKLEQATAELKLNEQRLGYTTLRADDAGVVTRVMAEVGSVVSAGQRVLSIARPSELEAVFDVPDSRIDEVRDPVGVQIALLSAPAAPYPARIREISPSADPVTRTYQVKTAIPNPPASLRLGMNVAITVLQRPGQSSVALPATALFQKDRDPAVWVIDANSRLQLRPVNVERYESDRVLVTEGLKTGERVVTAGVHRLAAGEQVRLLDGGAK